MTRKLWGAALAAALLATGTGAAAQTRELDRERRDVRAEQRDLREARADYRDARRYGDRDDIRDARRDVREERRELDRERRDYRQERREEWREHRARHRNLYRAPRFDAPFRYQRFGSGSAISSRYWAPAYTVGGYARYRLPAPGRYQRYVRHYDDLLLVNTRTGRVVRLYNGFYW